MRFAKLSICFSVPSENNVAGMREKWQNVGVQISGRNSMVECQLPKLKVASSSLVARSKKRFSVWATDVYPAGIISCSMDQRAGKKIEK